MINSSNSISMAEAKEYLEKDSEAKVFIDKFVSLKTPKAKELRKKLEGLDLMKINEDHITKIIDVLPEKSEDINKIFIDVSLDEDETTKILDTIKEFK